MYHFNKKQKIILGVLIAIIGGFIYYYVYAREDNDSSQINLENDIEIQEKKEEEEEYSDDRIFIHVSGAVNKEGIIELRIDSRVADAIDKARRHKRRCKCERY